MNLETSSGSFFAAATAVGPAVGGVTKQHMRARLYAALLALDCVAILVAFAAASYTHTGRLFGYSATHLLVMALPLYVAIAANRRAYSSIIFESRLRAAQIAVTSLLAAMLIVLSLTYYLQVSATISRVVFTLGTVAATVPLIALRLVFHRIALARMGGEPMAEVLICDGVEPPASTHARVIRADALGLVPNVYDPHALDRIGRAIHGADRVVIACAEGRRAAWAMTLKGANISGEIIAGELAEVGAIGAGEYDGQTTLLVSAGPLSLPSRAIKRAMDLAFAGAVLIAIAPLLAFVAIAIKLDSTGPVLFSQQRLGRGNRLFLIYKFRSMHTDQCDARGATSTTRGDKRVTRVGRFIRATSIDELPQIFNVLKGDMSVVGPRPHALGSLAGDKLFWEVDTRYWHRHAAKPGITGLAQVRGFRGATHMQSDLTDRLQADLDYVSNWTMWRDLSILIQTVRVVMHRNAY